MIRLTVRFTLPEDEEPLLDNWRDLIDQQEEDFIRELGVEAAELLVVEQDGEVLLDRRAMKETSMPWGTGLP